MHAQSWTSKILHEKTANIYCITLRALISEIQLGIMLSAQRTSFGKPWLNDHEVR